MKASLLTILFVLFLLKGYSQNNTFYSAGGQVSDSATLTPIEYATIVTKNKSTGAEKKVLGDKEGKFIIKNLPPGKYDITLLAAGYKAVNITADLSDTLRSYFDVGNIILAQQAKQLREVTVIAKKPLITQEIDRLAYNVQEDPDSKGINLLDMMRKVPFISVTGEDQVLFKGNSNFKILLDGRSSSLFANRNLKDVLKGIPAASILQIEVITVPPARYESEGLAGIINIITNKKLKDGYNGSINGNYSNLYSGASGSLNVKKGKFGLTAFGGSSWERLPLSPFTLSLSQFSSPSFELKQNGNRKYNSNNQYLNSFISFEPDSLHLITANAGAYTGFNKNKRNQSSQLADETGAITQTYDLLSINKNNETGWDAGINFQKGFKRNKAQLLTVSYKYISATGELNNTTAASEKMNYAINDIRQSNTTGFKEHSTQLDYVHPVKSLTIEAGAKFISRNKTGEFFHEDFNPTTGEFAEDPSKSDILEYEQDIFSIYNSYLLRKKKVAFRAGFRLETTSIDGAFKNTNTKIEQNYTNLLPSTSFLFRLKDMSTITIGYNQRIQRPGIQLLNPFVDQSDPRFYRSGNPDLLPVLGHNILLNYSRFKKSTINFGFSYSFARNTIQSVASSTGADSIIRITYYNVGSYDNAGLNMNLTFPLSKSMTLTVNGTVSYVWTKGAVKNVATENKGVEGFAYSYLSYRAKKNWRFNLNGGFYGPVRNLQGNSNSYFYSSVGASKQLFKQKVSFSMTISNPFQKFRTLNTVIKNSDFYQQTIYKNYFRNVSLSLFYRFGKLSEEVKRNKRNINNDDKAVETGKAQ